MASAFFLQTLAITVGLGVGVRRLMTVVSIPQAAKRLCQYLPSP